MEERRKIKPIVQKQGKIFQQEPLCEEIFCKPKLLPLKSLTLMKLEEMEKEIAKQSKTGMMTANPALVNNHDILN